MVAYGPPIASVLSICQRTCCTEHLDHRDEEQHHKHDPDDFVATKYPIQKVHISYLLLTLVMGNVTLCQFPCEGTKIIDKEQELKTIYPKQCKLQRRIFA